MPGAGCATATASGGLAVLAVPSDAMDLWHGGALFVARPGAAAGQGEALKPG